MKVEDLATANTIKNLVVKLEAKAEKDNWNLGDHRVERPFRDHQSTEDKVILSIENDLKLKLELCQKLIKNSTYTAIKELEAYFETL